MTAPEATELIAVGEVMGAHGVLGELKVKSHNPNSALLFELEHVFVQPTVSGAVQPGAVPEPPAAVQRQIIDVKEHGRGLLVRLEGCNSREDAQALYRNQLCVTRAQLPPTAADEFYVVDTLGAEVRSPAGDPLGVVEGFRDYPTVDVLLVRSEDGLREVPLIEPYFVSFEAAEQRVIVDHFSELDLELRRKRRRR